ncbi:MAG: helix-turn-helix domain-containing protein [Candidatus Baltobacteraceae bacterium]
MTPEEIVEFAEALARIAASGGGAKALAAHLARTAGGNVLLEDARWRNIAAAGTGRIPASARDVVESGAPGRALRVSAGNTHLGWLSLFANGSAREADLLLRLTAAAIAVDLAREAPGPREAKGGFWEALLARAFHDAGSMRDEAAARGIALASSYLAVALEAEGDLAELRALAAEVFRCAEADLGFLERGLSLLVFVPAIRSVDASNAKTAAGLLPKSAAKRRPHLRISGGVGTVETLLDIHASAATAETALVIVRRIYGSGRVASYEELGAYPLLYEGADVARMRAFAAKTLAPLRQYDEKHQTELERTLRLYFHVGQNVKTAAAELNVHRHTVFYRLRQIAEITARSLDTPHDQLTLRLAVAIDELHDST